MSRRPPLLGIAPILSLTLSLPALWQGGSLNSPAQQPVAPVAPQGYAAYALEHEGDAARGKAVYETAARSLCAMCHTVDGSSGKA